MERTPNRKQYPSFSGRIDLYAKVPFGKTIGHIVGIFRIFTYRHGDFSVETFIVPFIRALISTLDGGASSYPIETIVNIVLDEAGLQFFMLRINIDGLYIGVVALWFVDALKNNLIVACFQR